MQQQIIPDDYRQILSRLVARGVFPNEDAALKHAFELLVDEQQSDDEQSGEPAMSAEEWSQRFERLVDRHRPQSTEVMLPRQLWKQTFDRLLARFPARATTLDDSRESIYGDDGR